MPDLQCFTGTSLQKEFEDKLKEGGLSEKEAASQVIIDEHKRLHDALNRLKASPELKDFNLGQDEYVLPIDAEAIDNQKRRNEAEISALQNEPDLGGKEKVVTSQQIEKDANDIISDRLSPEEKSGAVAGGERNVEATNIVNRIHQSSEQGEGKQQKLSQEELRAQEEKALEAYAKENGIWVDDPFKEFGEKPDAFGAEQNVYLNKDGTTVTKLNSASLHGDWREFFERIAVHNFLFPDTKYTLKGFTNLSGDFTAIIEQPFITAERGATKSEIDYDMAKSGFNSIDDNTGNDYFNPQTGVFVRDLHGQNVLVDKNDNLFYIDPVIELDTPDKGYGGTRKIQQNETTNQQAGEADQQGDQPGQKAEPDTASANQAGEQAAGEGQVPPGQPPVDDGTGEEGKSKGNFNFFKNRDIPLTDEQKTHLSKPTLEVAGQEITQPFEYNVVTLDSMIDAGKRWMAEAKKQFNASKSEYAVRLFRDLRAMKGRMAVKAVGMVNLLNSIDNDLQFGNLTNGDRDRMRYVRGQLIDEIADNAREGSLTLNAQRLIHKLYKGEYKFTETMASVVTAPVQQAADDVATKLKKGTEEVSETVRENKRKKAAKEDTGDTPPAKPKKKEPKEKKTTFFSKALGAVDQEAIDKLKQQISDLAKDVKCGGK